MQQLEFYFDYLSPYAYFAWNELDTFCQDHGLAPSIKPVVFGKLLDHWGQLGPAEILPKREALIRYSLYYASTNHLPLAFPKNHPFNSLPALRASLPMVSGSRQAELVSAIFSAGWGKGQDIGDPAIIIKIAERVGIDRQAVAEAIVSENVKQALKDNTAEAIEKGVFGIPTMVYDDNLYWGNDQFAFLSAVIRGTYKTDINRFNDAKNRIRAIDRKRMP